MANRLKTLGIMFIYLTLSFSSDAQVRDTLQKKTKITSFVIPAVLITYGVIAISGKNPISDLDLSTKNELQEDHPLFAAHADDYLQFAPAAAVYGLHIAGLKGKHSLSDATALYVISEAIMGISTHSLKSWTGRLRPNGSANNSFPSGHTANAFASAEFLNQEYKDSKPWIGYSGYALATATGILRMYNNKHWLSDVVAGAGFGILSTKLSYLAYPYLKRKLFHGKPMNTMISPGYQNGHMNFNLIRRF